MIPELELEDLKRQESEQDEVLEGGLSPWCKEEIYRNYLAGWTVKDLSYKFGILPERVKAIVYHNVSWKEIYPKIGESGLRRRLEHSFEIAKRLPYIDYGKDLKAMAEREEGFRLLKVQRSEIDCKPSKEVEEKLSKVFKNTKPRRITYIPIKFVGKGPSGYLIKEMYVNSGTGSRTVGRRFKDFCKNKDLAPQTLPKKMLDRQTLGPRIACLGFNLK